MTEFPETRDSLLVQVRSPGNREAWDQFVQIYRPVIYRLPASLSPRPSFFNSHRKGITAMLVTLGFSLLGMILWQTSEPPDIAGDWVSEEWGNVILEATKPGRYEGTLSGPPSDGTMDLKWSRSEGRFNGTWKQSRHLGGKLSLRVVDSQIRGAWTTSKKSEAAAGTPRLCLDGIDTHDDRGTLVRNRRRIRSGGWGYCQAAEIS